MDAALVLVVDGAVAARTDLGDVDTGLRQDFSCSHISEFSLGVGIMTIRANGRLGVSARQYLLVNRIQGLVILRGMTLLAGGVHLHGEIPQALSLQFGMRKVANIFVAIRAIQSLVGRGGEMGLIDGQRKDFAIRKGAGHPWLVVTGQTG